MAGTARRCRAVPEDSYHIHPEVSSANNGRASDELTLGERPSQASGALAMTSARTSSGESHRQPDGTRSVAKRSGQAGGTRLCDRCRVLRDFPA